jgi:hypothetical protein
VHPSQAASSVTAKISTTGAKHFFMETRTSVCVCVYLCMSVCVCAYVIIRNMVVFGVHAKGSEPTADLPYRFTIGSYKRSSLLVILTCIPFLSRSSLPPPPPRHVPGGADGRGGECHRPLRDPVYRNSPE